MEISVARIHNRDIQVLLHGQEGLAWAMCGFAEELEWFDTVNETELERFWVKENI